jgi:ABC-type multidrug transport system ATPase subunit
MNLVDSLKDIAKDGILVETVLSGECAYPEQEKILTDMSAENRLDTMEWIGLVLIVLTVLGLIFFFIREKIRQNSLRKAPKPLPRTGINLAFTNLGYFVNEKQILKNVSGTCKSGRVIAIMGPSGAGKSTLLDILAGKSKSGEVQGDILVNGKRIQPKTFKNLAGYVDQEDLLLGSLTVRETLSFSAELRLPESLPKSEKMVIVDQTIKQLGLAHVSDSRIGGGGIRGISGGEKRRVSVGVEFVTSPSILFLDEPTSGLDSYNALMLVKTLANLAHKHGKTVIFTIHQPRSDVYKLFDDVLVLSKGEILYFGPANEANAFCESKDRQCPPGYNIADHLLDMAVAIGDAASAAGESIHGNNYVPKKLAELQPNGANQITKIKEVCGTESDEQGASEDTVVNLDVDGQNEHYTVSFLTQSTQLMRRSWKVLIRNPSLLVAHLSGSVLFGLFIGGLYYDSRRFEGMEGIQNRLGSVQFILSLVGFSSISAIGVSFI